MIDATGRVIATLYLNGYAGLGSDGALGVCPPVVDYSPVEQVRVAEEVAARPKRALIVGWLADYAVLREQIHRNRISIAAASFARSGRLST